MRKKDYSVHNVTSASVSSSSTTYNKIIHLHLLVLYIQLCLLPALQLGSVRRQQPWDSLQGHWGWQLGVMEGLAGQQFPSPKQGEKTRGGEGNQVSQQSGQPDMSMGMRQVWVKGSQISVWGLCLWQTIKVSHHPVISRQACSGEANPRSWSWYNGQMDQKRILATIQNSDILYGCFFALVSVSSWVLKHCGCQQHGQMLRCCFSTWLFLFFEIPTNYSWCWEVRMSMHGKRL